MSTTDQSESTYIAVPVTHYKYEQVDHVKVFYRVAGCAANPPLLLLHGFAASSFMFRDLITALADKYYVIAPDLPAFGHTQSPTREKYTYSFEQITNTIGQFIKQLALEKFALMIHDYGAPVGLRLAIQQPDHISAIISQSGNAYEEGLSARWEVIRQYWKEPNEVNRDALRASRTPEGIKWQYFEGVADTSRVAPDGYTLESVRILEPGNVDIQLDLILDYESNLALYPAFQHYFREYQPPLLAVWGKNDPIFLPAGAESWKRDIPNAEIHFFDTGHFALESHGEEIIPIIREFLDRTLG